MTKDKEARIIVETRDAKKEEELKKAEEQLERIERILGDVPSGWSVSINRKEPGWCRGHLETLAISDDSSLDLDYLAQTWGGHVLQARIKDEAGKYVRAVDIPMYSYDPKHWGEKKVHPNQRNREKEETKVVPRDPLSSIDGILSIIERLKAREDTPTQVQPQPSLDMEIIKLLFQQVVSAQQQSPSPLSGIEQVIEGARALKELKGLFGGSEDQSPIDSEDIFSKVSGILDSYGKIVNKSPEVKKPTISPPTLGAPNPGHMGMLPKPYMYQSPQADDEETVSSKLAQIAIADPRKATDTLALTLAKVPESKREELLTHVFKLLDVIDEDEESFDETVNNVQNLKENATSPPQQPENTGERLGSDDQDYFPNRKSN